MFSTPTKLGTLLTVFLACGSGSSGTARLPVATRTHTTSQPIDLDLHAVPIHDALVAIGTKAGVNFSLDPDVEGTVTLTVRARPWDEVVDQIVVEQGLKIEHLTSPKGEVLRISRATTQAGAVQYTGAPMDARFDEVPIRTVAKAFADFAKVQIVVDDDVQATVTQFMRAVPWDLALDHVARKYNLRLIRTGNLIRIAKQ